MKPLFAILTAAALAAGLPAAQTAYDSGDRPTSPDLTVLRVTPEGDDVINQRQIVVTFDRPVVALGDMRLDEQSTPVAIEPRPQCHWRWLDPRAVVCELDREAALEPATEYVVTVRAGLKAQDGSVLKERHRTTFTTERPLVRSYSFSSWAAPGWPKVQLVFNLPVTKESVERSLRFDGQRSKAEPAPHYGETYYALPLPGESAELVFPHGTPLRTIDDQPTDEARRVWLVSPIAELPLDHHAELSVHPGLRGYKGALKGREDRTVVVFDTYPELRFLGVSCRVGLGTEVVDPTSPTAAERRCNPLWPVSFVFSAPVIPAEVGAHVRLTPDLAGGRKDYDPWANVYPYSHLREPHQSGRRYEVQLPELLQAMQEYRIDKLSSVADEFGRKVKIADGLRFFTAHRDPDLRLSHQIAVLEKNAPTSVPLYVTNLDAIDVHYDTLTTAGRAAQQHARQPIDRVWDVAYAVPAMLRDLLHGGSGLIRGQFVPDPLPPQTDPAYRTDWKFVAQVTPFQVHAKLGRYNTLVWVTSLPGGKPVKGAQVQLQIGDGIDVEPTRLADAVTDDFGLALIDGDLADQRDLHVRVRRGKDFALLPLNQDFELDTYRASRGRIWSWRDASRKHVHAWGTTAQGVYRLGDAVQFKLYVRNDGNRTLQPAAADGYVLEVLDPTGKVVHQKSGLTLSEFGALDGEFVVPATGAVGWYAFRLSRADVQLEPMRVLIADFTPAPFRVQTTLNGDLYQPGDDMEVATRATLHAGGPYAKAGSRVVARVRPEPIEPTAAAAGFAFDSQFASEYCPWNEGGEAEQTLHDSQAEVDERGERVTRFNVPDTGIVFGRINVESAVADERGKFVAAHAPAQYRGRDRYVGIRSDRWTFDEDQAATIETLVIDERGRIVAGDDVKVEVHGQVTTAARVKGAGNAYLTSYENSWEDRGACEGKATEAPLPCTFTPTTPGLYSIRATVTDHHGRTHRSELCTWVTGKGQVIWNEPDDMSLSLVASKTSYRVGETARVLVRNPFPGARALITVERYGVIKRWVQRLDGNTPVIEFPIETDFLPGFYLSVVVMSPRVAPAPGQDPLDANGVDLGRPTYRMGYVQLGVTDPAKRLDVKIRSDRAVYKPGDTVKLSMHAAKHRGAADGAPIEMTVAVLDEAVFDLIQGGRGYFDPYAGLYKLDPLDLVNYGLLSRLVGLQKCEKKGASAGGDGGAGFDMREVSKYVAYWNPSVKADAQGNASLSFKLPDNLTGWRVLAIAATPGDRVGLGDATFKSSKPTELRPVLPNQVTDSDRFTAGFSVLNRANKTRSITVEIAASGAIADGRQSTRKVITLEAFKREAVFIELTAKGKGAIDLAARAFDARDHDGLKAKIDVHERVALDVAASYGTTLKDQVEEPIAFPLHMQPGVGALTVQFSPSVIGNIDGAFRYARAYPYACWEQRLTKALLAAGYLQLGKYLPPDLTWPEAATLPQMTLDAAANFQAPDGGMTFWGGDNERVNPYLSAATALAFNQLREYGYRVPEGVEAGLHRYLDRFLRGDAKPTFYSEGMASSVRAVMLLALAQQKQLQLADLERYRPAAARMDLFGVSAYMRAALLVEGGAAIAREQAQRILGHANETAGKFQVLEVWDDGYSQMLSTPLRSQCAVLHAFLDYGETPQGAPLVGDAAFKLMRFITAARGSRDHWENTQENLYCAAALSRYSQLYEKDTPQLQVSASLDGQSLGDAHFETFRDPPTSLKRPNVDTDAGRKTTLTIDRSGTGRAYYVTRLSYSLTDEPPKDVNAGIEIRREYSVQRDGTWQLLTSPMQIARGEIVRVDLYVSLAGARNFVVVDDPVPGGLEPVNRDLATASTVDADRTEFQAAGGAFWFHYGDWSEYGISFWNFYHRELRHDSARFFADYLAAGHYHLSYAAQAIAEGTFVAQEPRAEEMYDPDVYGRGVPGELQVRP